MSTYILDLDPMSYRMYLKLSMWRQNCLKLAPVCPPPGRSTVCVCVCVCACVCVWWGVCVGVKGGEVIMVRPEGSGLEEGGVVGARGKEQVKG